jgi:phage shock protein A
MTDILESLAETRVTLAYLAQKAKEEGNADLARRLNEQSQTLREEIARLRKAGQSTWRGDAEGIADQFRKAQSELKEEVKKIEADRKALGRAVKVLSVVGKLVDLIGRLGA